MSPSMLLWLGCTPPSADEPPAETGFVDTDAPADTGSPPPPTLASPADAVDLDPDPDVLHVALTAARHVWEADGTVVEGYAYNGRVPGPTLRLKRGDRLVVDLQNDSDLFTSIHWHGVSVPYAMDGAGWMVEPVAPGEPFQYTFTVEQAGTFWYHPHFDTERSVDLGLYGVIVVEDPDEPTLEEELVVVLDSVLEAGADPSDQGIEPSPVRWLANGLVEPVWSVAAGRRARIRLVNVSNVGYLSLDGIVAIGGDQGLLSAVRSAVRLPPGDRAELLWTGDGALQTEPWSMVGPGVGPPQTLFSVQREGSAPEPSADWPTSGALPTPDPGRTDLRYTFTGSPTAGWAINGQTWPEIEPDRFTLGDTIVLEIRNPSPAHHPFHLHGLEFEVLSVDGVAPVTRRVEDTFDVGIRQTVRLLVEADNPGEWMSHCHILPHARQGMMTILSVSE